VKDPRAYPASPRTKRKDLRVVYQLLAIKFVVGTDKKCSKQEEQRILDRRAGKLFPMAQLFSLILSM
jgi:hypothetical protein